MRTTGIRNLDANGERFKVEYRTGIPELANTISQQLTDGNLLAYSVAMLPPAPPWAVPVRVSFLFLVLSRACTIREAWLLSRGALVSPLTLNNIMQEVRRWRGTHSECSKSSRRRLRHLLHRQRIASPALQSKAPPSWLPKWLITGTYVRTRPAGGSRYRVESASGYF